MKPIVKKVLESGLIDKSVASLLEKWGNIPAGSSDLVKDDALKNATKEHITKLAEDLAIEVERDRTVRETSLDLSRIRWPALISIVTTENSPKIITRDAPPVNDCLVYGLQAVVDRMGRYYVRPNDLEKDPKTLFIPGYFLYKMQASGLGDWERIMESQPLFVDETLVCWQISTMKA